MVDEDMDLYQYVHAVEEQFALSLRMESGKACDSLPAVSQMRGAEIEARSLSSDSTMGLTDVQQLLLGLLYDLRNRSWKSLKIITNVWTRTSRWCTRAA